MTKKITWGILGWVRIAHKFAGDLKPVKDAELIGVASRDLARATEFGGTYGTQFIFDDYADLASSPAVDVIYIATPHGIHYEHVMLCLWQHRKATTLEMITANETIQKLEVIQEEGLGYQLEAPYG